MDIYIKILGLGISKTVPHDHGDDDETSRSWILGRFRSLSADFLAGPSY